MIAVELRRNATMGGGREWIRKVWREGRGRCYDGDPLGTLALDGPRSVVMATAVRLAQKFRGRWISAL